MKQFMKIRNAMISIFFGVTCLYFTVDVRAETLISAEEKHDVSQVLGNLFAALKSGDVDTLTRLFADDMYLKNKTLLENNSGYADFLRNYYREALFKVTEILRDNEGIRASFITLFPDGNKKTTHLIMAQRLPVAQKRSGVPVLFENGSKGWFVIRQVEER